MYLQKLEIQGFKSFANKTTLEFNRQLTAVVGPNGSGKSNIADAIRWVLGEQSIKLLRGKRAEDVIFAGSDVKSRLGMAEVSLFLNNENGTAVEYPEIVITRRVFRDGQSEYLLNQAPVRLQDIQLLLARANFGQKTYSVIGQGMIDSIVMSSPAERKEFFEEATGVKQYQLKREQAIQKLVGTYENLDQAKVLLVEIEPRLRVLTRQVKRLERREELERELRTLQKKYFRCRYHQTHGRRTELGEKVKVLQAEYKIAHESARQLEAELKKLESKTSVSDAWGRLQLREAELRRDLTQAMKERALAEAAETVKHLQKGEGEIAWLKQRGSELASEIKNLGGRLGELQRLLVSAQSELNRQLNIQAKQLEMLKESGAEDNNDWFIREFSVCLSEYTELRHKISSIKNVSDVQAVAHSARVLEDHLRAVQGRLGRKSKGSTNEQNTFVQAREESLKSLARLETEINHLNTSQAEVEKELVQRRNDLDKINVSLSTKSATGEPLKFAVEISQVEEELKKVEQELTKFHLETESAKVEFFSVQKRLTEASAKASNLSDTMHEFEVEIARLDTKLEDLEREMAQDVPSELVFEIKKDGGVEVIEEGSVALEVQRLKNQVELTGGIEPEVITEYQQTKTRFDFLTTQIDDLETAAQSLESIIGDLDNTIQKKFLASFKLINEKFAKYFQVLFNGGKAQLVLQKEEEEELEGKEDESVMGQPVVPSAKEKFLAQEKRKAGLFSGVELTATPPGKKLSSINALSGGEKALTSIALICAIISNNPSPFVVLDEVDAALDEANSERFAAIVDSLMNETQFITITHNRATMRRAAILYGVTMGDDGVSRLLSVKLEEAKEIVKL